MMTDWDARYSEPDYVYGTEPNTFLQSVIDYLPKGHVLSIAEGEGRNGVFLASLGFEVTGVDSSAAGLHKAQQLARQRSVQIETVVADLSAYVIAPQHWDVIVSIFAHVPRQLRRQLYADCVRGLKPGGVIVIEAYTPAQIELGTGGPKDPDMTPTLLDLEQELSGLEMIIARETVRDVIEGRYHTGRAAVVQLVARRGI